MMQTALKYDLEVLPEGRLDLRVPYPSGARVVVFVVGEPADSYGDLLSASQTSLAFWDNPLDDEDWNHA